MRELNKINHILIKKHHKKLLFFLKTNKNSTLKDEITKKTKKKNKWTEKKSLGTRAYLGWANASRMTFLFSFLKGG
jgi:hypothetical protein